MKYTIYPRIACLVKVVCDDFPEHYGERQKDYIFMAEGKPVEAGIGNNLKFGELPPAVQESINSHFADVFALTVEERGGYLKTTTPWEIEA